MLWRLGGLDIKMYISNNCSIPSLIYSYLAFDTSLFMFSICVFTTITNEAETPIKTKHLKKYSVKVLTAEVKQIITFPPCYLNHRDKCKTIQYLTWKKQ